MDFRQHLSDSRNEITEYIQEGGNRGGDSENTVLLRNKRPSLYFLINKAG